MSSSPEASPAASPEPRPPVRSHTTELPAVPGALSLASVWPFSLDRGRQHPWWVWMSTLFKQAGRGALSDTLGILAYGVADHSSLGEAGLCDGAPGGMHLSPGRAQRIQLHTQAPLPPADLFEVARLRRMSADQLAELGRLSSPYIHRPGARGFERASWSDALSAVRDALPKPRGKRMAFLAGADGLSLEAAYAVSKTARCLATNHVDLCVRHNMASGRAGLRTHLGTDSASSSLSELEHAQLILLVGTNLVSAHPRAGHLLLQAKRRGARIVVINPVREPSLAAAWEAGDLRASLFGARIADDFVQVAGLPGSDAAFFDGVAKAIIERDGTARGFVADHTDAASHAALCASLAERSWEDLETAAGCLRRDMEWVAELAVRAERAVSLVGPWVLSGTDGADNAGALCNLHLLRGWFGRSGCGVIPVAPSAGFEGARLAGVDPARFPGGAPIDAGSAAELAQHWDGVFVPVKPGLRAHELAEAGAKGLLDLLVCVGADPVGQLPRIQGLDGIGVRVHLDTWLRPSMVAKTDQLTVLLPIQGLYTQPGGATLCTTDRRLRFSPPIVAPVGEARPVWSALHALATTLDPDLDSQLQFAHSGELSDELARVVPALSTLKLLKQAGDWVQPGGPVLFEAGRFTELADHRAVFAKRAELDTSQALRVSSRRTPSLGRRRDAVVMSPADADARGLSAGDAVQVESENGNCAGVLVLENMPVGTLQVCWPEGADLFTDDPDAAAPAVVVRRAR